MRCRRDRDPIAERLADRRCRLQTRLGQRHRRLTLDDQAGRIFIAVDVRTGLTVYVRVVAVGKLAAAYELGLVADDDAVGKIGIYLDVELHRQLAPRRQIEIADIEQPRVIGAAVRVGVARVGAGRNRSGHERQGTGHEDGRCVQLTEVVIKGEVVQRTIRRLQPQRITQHVPGRRRVSRALTAGQVGDGLLEKVPVECDGCRMQVLVVDHTRRTVGYRPRVNLPIGIAAIAVVPLGDAGNVG